VQQRLHSTFEMEEEIISDFEDKPVQITQFQKYKEKRMKTSGQIF
jgi:hypothetical protein